jgi:hypothetical protein
MGYHETLTYELSSPSDINLTKGLKSLQQQLGLARQIG